MSKRWCTVRVYTLSLSHTVHRACWTSLTTLSVAYVTMNWLPLPIGIRKLYSFTDTGLSMTTRYAKFMMVGRICPLFSPPLPSLPSLSFSFPPASVLHFSSLFHFTRPFLPILSPSLSSYTRSTVDFAPLWSLTGKRPLKYPLMSRPLLGGRVRFRYTYARTIN